MEFDFNNYKGKYVMHCKTEKEAEEFCKVMHEDGKTWSNRVQYIQDILWKVYLEDTCYDFNKGMYCSESFFQEANYMILEWEDFRFTTAKEVLKVGYVVELYNDRKYIVMQCEPNLIITDATDWFDIEEFNNDLTFKRNENIGINKIYGYTKTYINSLINETYTRELLWER